VRTADRYEGEHLATLPDFFVLWRRDAPIRRIGSPQDRRPPPPPPGGRASPPAVNRTVIPAPTPHLSSSSRGRRRIAPGHVEGVPLDPRLRADASRRSAGVVLTSKTDGTPIRTARGREPSTERDTRERLALVLAQSKQRRRGEWRRRTESSVTDARPVSPTYGSVRPPREAAPDGRRAWRQARVAVGRDGAECQRARARSPRPRETPPTVGFANHEQDRLLDRAAAAGGLRVAERVARLPRAAIAPRRGRRAAGRAWVWYESPEFGWPSARPWPRSRPFPRRQLRRGCLRRVDEEAVDRARPESPFHEVARAWSCGWSWLLPMP
jgi:hypothetical protein